MIRASLQEPCPRSNPTVCSNDYYTGCCLKNGVCGGDQRVEKTWGYCSKGSECIHDTGEIRAKFQITGGELECSATIESETIDVSDQFPIGRSCCPGTNDFNFGCCSNEKKCCGSKCCESDEKCCICSDENNGERCYTCGSPNTFYYSNIDYCSDFDLENKNGKGYGNFNVKGKSGGDGVPLKSSPNNKRKPFVPNHYLDFAKTILETKRTKENPIDGLDKYFQTKDSTFPLSLISQQYLNTYNTLQIFYCGNTTNLFMEQYFSQFDVCSANDKGVQGGFVDITGIVFNFGTSEVLRRYISLSEGSRQCLDRCPLVNIVCIVFLPIGTLLMCLLAFLRGRRGFLDLVSRWLMLCFHASYCLYLMSVFM
ncbi:hypothetical protein M0813_25081 [Anaeramoeba flamelloides]|uniref:Uncharacterized protein n=1 Tax=Anaeramoeba flamelloides TaxID=1746091 RepID=A0ABQ8Y4S5_9EUKA|nr:hypothetical protein M0813_25081 [Anaeramoeba flamelloides]